MNLPTALFTPLPSSRNFDEYTIEADHTKLTFWWDFRIFDEYTIEADHPKMTFCYILMNLPSGIFTLFEQN